MKPGISTSRITLLCLLLVVRFTLEAFAQVNDDKHATFFMGRVRYSANDGNDCSGVGQDLMKLVSRASTLKVQEERKVKLTRALGFPDQVLREAWNVLRCAGGQMTNAAAS